MFPTTSVHFNSVQFAELLFKFSVCSKLACISRFPKAYICPRPLMICDPCFLSEKPLKETGSGILTGRFPPSLRFKPYQLSLSPDRWTGKSYDQHFWCEKIEGQRFDRKEHFSLSHTELEANFILSEEYKPRWEWVIWFFSDCYPHHLPLNFSPRILSVVQQKH